MNEQPTAAKPKRQLRTSQEPAAALEQHAPWRPFLAFSPEEHGALLALSRGQAEPHQQVMVLKLVDRMSHNAGAHYFPGEDGQRNTDFALGRAWVGQQIATLLKLKLNVGGEHG